MLRKFTAVIAALSLAGAAIAPTAASARDRYDDHGRHGGYYDRDYHDRGRHGRRHDHDNDNGEAVAAGILGLVLGVVIASAASQPRPPQGRCTTDYQRCAPPQGYYDYGPTSYDGPPPQYYDDRRTAYEQDYGYAPPSARPCTRRERQWDRYAGRYLMVDVPC